MTREDATPATPEPGDAVRAPHPAEVLAAERAGTRYWRTVAQQRRRDAAAVQRRPLVRVAVVVDRRTRRVQDAAGAATAELRRLGRRVAVATGGWRARTQRRARLAHLEAQVGASANGPRPAPPAETPAEEDRETGPRSVLVVHLGPVPTLGPHHDEVVGIPWPDLTSGRDPVRRALGRVDEVVGRSGADVVCLLGPGVEPLGERELDDLVAGVDLEDGIAAVTPLVVHPDRPWGAATAHDLLVRAAGLDTRLRGDGAPVLRSRQAGDVPDTAAPPREVLAASSAALAVRRDAWLGAGGLAISPAPDLDAAVVDLCLRMRRAGARVGLVPSAVVADHRPVTGTGRLAGPLDDEGPAWRALVEEHGARLWWRARPRPPRGTGPPVVRVALTAATPSRKLAPRSGDWHFAEDLARALRRDGHEVRIQSHEEADSLAGRACDTHIVLRGLEPVRRTRGQVHVLWIISHPEAVDVAECDEADLVLVASPRFAAHLRTRTRTPVEVLLQATDPHRFRPGPDHPGHRHPVTVVASSRGVLRTAVADALDAGVAPSIHGDGWSGLVDPALVCEDYVSPDLVASVYRSAGVVLNDHWETMRRWGFVSNRVFDVLACGTPVVSDHLPELTALFGDLVPTWTDAEGLAGTVEELRSDPSGTARRVAAARDLVLASHTFDQRAVELFDLLARHDLVPPVDGAP